MIEDPAASIIPFIANVGINDEKAQEIAIGLSEGVVQRRFKLLDLVVALKEELLSNEASQRQKALHCLSSVLAELPEDQLSKNEVSVVFSFYLSKYEDSNLIKETLHGLSSLAKMRYMSRENTESLMDLLTSKYQSGSFLAPVRYFAFETIKNIYMRNETKLVADNDFADVFVKCYIHVVSGEKDPRNLLISFKLSRQMTSTLKNISKFKEELFDILFCYFPITFKPPKDDPYKISNADLKLALRSAMSANAEFSEDAFGNLIDKLTASSPVVKNDTLLTLKTCVDNFGGEALVDNWLPLWNALKFEIIHGNDESSPIVPVGQSEPSGDNVNNYQEALNVMKSLSYGLITFDGIAFEKFFGHIYEELKPNFTHDKDLKQSCCILASIGSANVDTFNKVIESSLPLFLSNTSATAKLKLIIMNLSFFFKAYAEVFNTMDSSDEKIRSNKLLSFKDEILMILSKALTGTSKVETTLRTLAVIQFTKMTTMKDFLDKDEVALIIQYLTETILTDDNKNIYCACLEGLKTIGDTHEETILHVSLTRMLDLLPVSEKAISMNSEPIERESVLRVLLDFTTSKHSLVNESLIKISSKSNSTARCGDDSEYCFLLASALFTLMVNNIDSMSESDAILLKENVEPLLLQLLTEDSNVFIKDHTRMLLSNVLFFISLKLPVAQHQQNLETYKELFNSKLKIFEKPAHHVFPFVQLLAAASNNCKFEDADSIFEKAIRLITSKHPISEFEKLGYLELLMVLSNKWVPEDTIERLCDWDDLSFSNLETLIWIGKGLIMRNCDMGLTFQERLADKLSREDVGSFVAKKFEVLVTDLVLMGKYKGVPLSNNVRLLYKQKYFSEVFPKLLDQHKRTSNLLVKANYLTALALTAKHIPPKVMEPYMPEFTPILLQALNLPMAEVKVSALKTLKDTVKKHNQLATEYAQSLYPVLLKLVLPGPFNDVQVRLLSLELLETLSAVVPINYSQPHKNDIIRGLEPVLDDTKRIVRKQCVATRQAFFELGQVPFD
ncbi:hypothetical protein HG536_0B02910 [Torulaspora globosa]|uniref:MMS19 nucleotide excision repair protein n=1 Tax=Torulaspora globosa TaxID=48254 RepID=A0A7G3ZD42_9SACH|nr:uncharacterized protein HG536_0B02910 [Torulaspora globosa]QLL31428.1 hypothetical protein HG536_0B02910 [Torulaspora globosa]